MRAHPKWILFVCLAVLISGGCRTTKTCVENPQRETVVIPADSDNTESDGGHQAMASTDVSKRDQSAPAADNDAPPKTRRAKNKSNNTPTHPAERDTKPDDTGSPSAGHDRQTDANAPASEQPQADSQSRNASAPALPPANTTADARQPKDDTSKAAPVGPQELAPAHLQADRPTHAPSDSERGHDIGANPTPATAAQTVPQSSFGSLPAQQPATQPEVPQALPSKPIARQTVPAETTTDSVSKKAPIRSHATAVIPDTTDSEPTKSPARQALTPTTPARISIPDQLVGAKPTDSTTPSSIGLPTPKQAGGNTGVEVRSPALPGAAESAPVASPPVLPPSIAPLVESQGRNDEWVEHQKNTQQIEQRIRQQEREKLRRAFYRFLLRDAAPDGD